jgi:hypothetical protein
MLAKILRHVLGLLTYFNANELTSKAISMIQNLYYAIDSYSGGQVDHCG